MPQHENFKNSRPEPYRLEKNKLNPQDKVDKLRSPLQRIADAGEQKQQLFETFNDHYKKMIEEIKEYKQKITDFGKIVKDFRDKNIQDSYRATSNAMSNFAKKLENGNYPYMDKEIVRQLDKKLRDAINHVSYYASTKDTIKLLEDNNLENLQKMSGCIKQIANNAPNDRENKDLDQCKKQYDELNQEYTSLKEIFVWHYSRFGDGRQQELYRSLTLGQKEKKRINDWLAGRLS